MKKRLEADLMSLAHRILQLKNKQDVEVLQQEALKLYEKLSVLKFVEEHFGEDGPTIGREAFEATIEAGFTPATPVEKAEEAPKEKAAEPEVAEAEPQAEEAETANQDAFSLIEQLAASKTVASDEPEISEEASEEVTTEATSEEEVSEEEEVSGEEASEETEEETTEEGPEVAAEAEEASETQTAESPTFEQGQEFVEPETEKEVEAAVSEKAEDSLYAPSFELDFEAKPTPKNYDEPAPSFTFDDLLGKDYVDPVFVTPDELKAEAEKPAASPVEAAVSQTPDSEEPAARESSATEEVKAPDDIWSRRPFEGHPDFDKPIPSPSLNEKLSKGITIGLNDRIAFMKNLFNNSSEDYNRVLSQLMTIDNYRDARQFIEEMVKPDYNNWQGKEEFEERFMEIVEKRFL